MLISVLLIGCGSSNPINNDDNTQAKGDWPVYDFEEIIDEVDLIAFTTVENTQSKEIINLIRFIL
ncbi:hypothetical protein GCM10008983_14960 [Lentibacillus halophilus]|uniref:Uncharacterized protein n=1 Tax=Lentibacillus halophilus TaxID=295065 RepID=A0ABN0Z8N0_9BACI